MSICPQVADLKGDQKELKHRLNEDVLKMLIRPTESKQQHRIRKENICNHQMGDKKDK
ncbi:hypothetical protein E2C01_043210 [Portunus trituberculatus]|uniref:Uncharacterized protein n=1 Tax=Portunus trituberculatus TaxID=210409 RepID=A0A5B7FPN9_PORTR|nr:hypothetical protein [Portunus trituberculatus]